MVTDVLTCSGCSSPLCPDCGLFPPPPVARRLLVPVPAQDAAREIDELQPLEVYL